MFVARIETPTCSVLGSVVVIGAPTETGGMAYDFRRDAYGNYL